MLQKEECQNKKEERSCIQSIKQKKRNYGRTGEWQHASQRKKYSKGRDQPKEHQENVQDVERGIVEYWSKKDRYAQKYNS